MVQSHIFKPARLIGVPAERRAARRSRRRRRRLRDAMTTLTELERSPVLAISEPVLSRALHTLSNVRVRNIATVGGHLAHGDPHGFAADPRDAGSARARGVAARQALDRGCRPDLPAITKHRSPVTADRRTARAGTTARCARRVREVHGALGRRLAGRRRCGLAAARRRCDRRSARCGRRRDRVSDAHGRGRSGAAWKRRRCEEVRGCGRSCRGRGRTARRPARFRALQARDGARARSSRARTCERAAEGRS